MQENRIPYEKAYIEGNTPSLTRGERVIVTANIVALTTTLILMVLGVI